MAAGVAPSPAPLAAVDGAALWDAFQDLQAAQEQTSGEVKRVREELVRGHDILLAEIRVIKSLLERRPATLLDDDRGGMDQPPSPTHRIPPRKPHRSSRGGAATADGNSAAAAPEDGVDMRSEWSGDKRDSVVDKVVTNLQGLSQQVVSGFQDLADAGAQMLRPVAEPKREGPTGASGGQRLGRRTRNGLAAGLARVELHNAPGGGGSRSSTTRVEEEDFALHRTDIALEPQRNDEIAPHRSEDANAVSETASTADTALMGVSRARLDQPATSSGGGGGDAAVGGTCDDATNKQSPTACSRTEGRAADAPGQHDNPPGTTSDAGAGLGATEGAGNAIADHAF